LPPDATHWASLEQVALQLVVPQTYGAQLELGGGAEQAPLPEQAAGGV